jgi:hypothetical protein
LDFGILGLEGGGRVDGAGVVHAGGGVEGQRGEGARGSHDCVVRVR